MILLMLKPSFLSCRSRSIVIVSPLTYNNFPSDVLKFCKIISFRLFTDPTIFEQCVTAKILVFEFINFSSI